jgi:DNA polymerase-3 subunit gamma/tau
MSELLGLLHQIALTQFVPDACKLETSTPKVIYHLASTTSPEHVQLCYQIVLQGKRDLPYAADGRSGLEMTLLRLLAFKPTVQKKTPEIVNQLATELGDEPSLASSELNQHDLQSDAAPISETPVVSTSSKLEHNMDSIEHAQLVEQQQDIIQQAASLVDEMPEPTTSSETTYEIPSTENEGERLPYNEPSDIAVLQEGLHEAGNLSDTASLIAMKQQIKELNKVELEKTNRAESSEARDFEKLPFPSKKDNKESLQVAEEQSLGPEEPIDFKATEEYSGTETDIPPFDIDEPIQMIPSEQLPETDLDNTVIATQENLDAPLSEGVSEQVVSNIDDIGTPQITEQFDPSIDFTIVDDVEVTIPIEAFNHQGDKIVGAKQVDHWSHVIERMDVRGLTKQLALHSNYSFNDQTVTLLIAENKSHLNTDIARAQIKQSLEHLLEKPIELIIAFGEPVNTPFAIQQKINKVRHQYAYHLLDQDENIAAFRQRFDAAVEPESTFAR